MADTAPPIAPRPALSIDAGVLSAAGARSENQDAVRHAVQARQAYAVLADGAGGHAGGAIASDLAARLVALRLAEDAEPLPQRLSHHLEEAHQALRERQRDVQAAHQRMHTTVVALFIDRLRHLALWSHVGDSRLYLLRGGTVRHVTRDDTVVRSMLDAGFLSPDEAAVHPKRHQLLGALGADGPLAPHTLWQPWPLEDGDAFLLCSDGWWEDLAAATIEETFAQARDPQDWLARMERCIAAAARPDQDNYSAVAIWAKAPARRDA